MCIPSITNHPQSVTISPGAQTTLSVVATGTGLSYQWYQGPSGTTTTPVGTNSSTLTVQPSSTTKYWVKVSGCGTPASSNEATVTVCQTTSVGTPTTMLPTMSGGTNSVSVSATGTGLSYQWYRGPSGNTSTPVFTNASYVAFTVYQSDYYWVKVSSTCASPVNSSAVMVSVYPTISTQPQSVTIPIGTSTTLSVAANGTYLGYQWYRGYPPDTSNPVGTSAPTLTTPALTQNTPYWVRVFSGTAQGDSNAATVTLCQGPFIGTGTMVLGNGSCWYVIVDVYDYASTEVTYQWYQGQSGDTSHPIGTGSSYEMVCPTVQTTYWARVWTPDHTCYSNSSNVTVH
jgi:hypothetical protein